MVYTFNGTVVLLSWFIDYCTIALDPKCSQKERLKMLPYQIDMTESERHQWDKYQLVVMNKFLVQLHDNFTNKDQEKFDELLTIALEYGKILSSKDFEFELERNLMLHTAFEELRDFV